MQYILDENEYDEYMELKKNSQAQVEHRDTLIELMANKNTQTRVEYSPMSNRHTVYITTTMDDMNYEANIYIKNNMNASVSGTRFL